MGPGHILLVGCYELGRPSYSIALSAATLERADELVAVWDLQLAPLPLDLVRGAKVIVFFVPMHTALRLGQDAAKQVRQIHPSARVGFVGHYAGLHHEWLLGHVADFVLSGEFESSLVGAISGASTEAQPIVRRGTYLAGARALMPPLSAYAKIIEGESSRLAGTIESSRGCKHACRHCPIPAVYQQRFFAVPIDVVLADAAAQVEMGATHLTFSDPDFLNGPTHALRVAKAVHERWPHVTFDATAKIEHIVREGARLFRELRRCGLSFLVTAVESRDDRVLEILHKGHTRQDSDRALQILDECGVAIRPTFLPFTPWERLAGYLEILRWIEANDLVEHVDSVQYAIRLLVPPGSLLLQAQELRPSWGELDEESLTYRWQHPDVRMEDLFSQVSSIVEMAVGRRQPIQRTFRSVCDVAYAIADLKAPPMLASRRAVPPRLSEPWFC